MAERFLNLVCKDSMNKKKKKKKKKNAYIWTVLSRSKSVKALSDKSRRHWLSSHCYILRDLKC